VSSGFLSQAEYQQRFVDDLRHGPYPVVLLLGLGGPAGEPPGPPGVADLADAHARQLRNPDLLAALDRARGEATDEAARAAAYARAFAEWVGPTAFDVVVQHAVLRAYRARTAPGGRRGPWRRIEFRAAEQLEDDQAGWVVSDAVAALGRLLARLPDRFGHRVLTTQVDPLLEIAVRRAGGVAIPTTLRAGNSVSSTVPGAGVVQVVHLHGYWRAVRWEDNRTVLVDPDRGADPTAALARQLSHLLRGGSVYVLAGADAPELVRAGVRRLLAAEGGTVRWALPGPAGAAGYPLPNHEPDGALAVYAGVDPATLFPAVAARFPGGPARIPAASRSPEPPPVVQSELARRLGATPLRRPAEDAHDLLRQLAVRFGWRLERPRSLTLPTLLFWPARLRRPTVIHMVQAMAAAALSAHRVQVVVSLDDLGPPPRDTTAAGFAGRVRDWFSVVPGAQEPEIVLLSRYIEENDVFAGPPDRGALLRATRPWAVAREYYGEFNPSAFSVLAAVKILPDIEPDRAFEHAHEIVRALLHGSANRLLTPLTVWSHLNHLLLDSPAEQTVTLGGEDERRFWAHWRDKTQLPTGHLYHPLIDNVTNESAMVYWAHADDLRHRLAEHVGTEGWRGKNRYVPWLVHNALVLPEYLRTGGGLRLGGRPFDAWQDVLAALERDPALVDPVAEAISALFLRGDDL
jgi:hypothetical protein